MLPHNMQTDVIQCFKSLNVDTVCVPVIDNRVGIASAIGLYVKGTIPFLNLNVNATFGVIYVNTDYMNRNLTIDEQKFVLAHEASHIYLNHVVPIAIDKLIDEIIKYCDRDFHAIINLVKIFLYLLGVPPPLARLIKEQELAADIQAISLTNNETAAESCLTKLVNGDLNRVSHTWETLGVKMPIMTMRERLQEIRRKIMEIHKVSPIQISLTLPV